MKEMIALEMRLLHEEEVLTSPLFVARLCRGFGKVTVTDTSLAHQGTAGLGQTGDRCQAEAAI